MRLLFFLFAVWWAFVGVVHAQIITEIMYNPVGDDNNKEYVELYSEEELNLTGWTFEDSQSSDVLVPLQVRDSPYLLLVEEGFNLTDINSSVYSAGASLGNNLNNAEDTVLLRTPGGVIVDSVSYRSSDGGNGDGFALCVENRTLSSCSATPGESNKEHEGGEGNQTGGGNQSSSPDYGGVTIHELFPDPAGDDNALMPDGEWVELHNEGQVVDVAGLTMCDKGEHCVTLSNAHVMGDTLIPYRGYLVVYLNEESLLNNNGYEELSLKYGTTLLDRVSYTDSRMGMSWSVIDEGLYLTAPTPGRENSLDNETAAPENERESSYVTIQDIEPTGQLHFGTIFQVHLEVYKGNTNRKIVYVSVGGLGEKSSATFEKKYTLYDVTLPVVTPLNCDQKYPEGNYTVVAEGFGMKGSRIVSFAHSSSCSQHEASTLPSQASSSPERAESESVIKRTADRASMNSSSRKGTKVQGAAVRTAQSAPLFGYGGLVVALGVLGAFAYYLLRRST